MLPYNGRVNDEIEETDDPLDSKNQKAAAEPDRPGAPDPAATLPPDLLLQRSEKPAWKSGGATPGRWTTIGCGLGIVMLIAALFAGSSLMKRTVWTGFAGTRQRVVVNLPGNLPPGERMQLVRNLDRFAVLLENHSDPYPLMGDFQRRVRAAFEDGQITREEATELNAFLEENLPGGRSDVPYSMP
jgi:hypothetical protein